MKWTKRDIGTVLMMGGFVYALLMMMMYPEEKEASLFGFALIGFGAVFGTTGRKKKNSVPKKPQSGTAAKRKKKK